MAAAVLISASIVAVLCDDDGRPGRVWGMFPPEDGRLLLLLQLIDAVDSTGTTLRYTCAAPPVGC